MKKLKKQFDVRLGSGLGLLLLFTTLSLASCGEQREFDQPEVADGETVEVTQEIQVNVLPIQNMGAGTRATDQPEKGESVHMSFDTNATTRVDEDMTAAEAEIKSAFLVQFNGTNPTSTAAVVMDITNAMINGEPIKPTFRMTGGIKNRVYVISNPATRPVLGMTLATFEAPVAYTPGPLPATGLPTLAYQNIGVGDSFGVFQLKCPLAKVTVTVDAAGGVEGLSLKNIPSHYFIRASDSNANFPLTDLTVNLTQGVPCYMPENRRGRNEELIRHNTRCEYFAPLHSTFMNMTRLSASVNYRVYLGDGSPQDFNIIANYAYNIKVSIYGRDLGDLRVDGGISSGASLTNLSYLETANCYVIEQYNKPEVHWSTFDSTVGGNGADVSWPSGAGGTGTSIRPVKGLRTVDAEVLWLSSPTPDYPDYNGLKVYALRDKILVRTEGKEIMNGYSVWHNAVVAGHGQEGEITWSWHLWRVQYMPRSVRFSSVVGQQPVDIKVMDRNLGAATDTYVKWDNGFYTLGLLYQWGRKDPFPGFYQCNDNTPAGIWPTDAIKTAPKVADARLSIANPTTFYTSTGAEGDWTTRNDNLWGIPSLNPLNIFGSYCEMSRGKKTIYDPCPAGWRVSWDYTYANLRGEWAPPASAFKDGFTWLFAGLPVLDSGMSTEFPQFSYPLAGKREASSGALRSGTGTYWNATPRKNTVPGSTMTMTNQSVNWYDEAARAEGRSVRCAADPDSEFVF